jgi:hypothetical protein
LEQIVRSRAVHRDVDRRAHAEPSVPQFVRQPSADAEAGFVAGATSERVADDHRHHHTSRRLLRHHWPCRHHIDRPADVAAQERVESGAESNGRCERAGHRHVPQEQFPHPRETYHTHPRRFGPHESHR